MNRNVKLGIAIVFVITLIILLQRPMGSAVERVTPALNKTGVVVPELVGIVGYINTPEFNISSLIGKKVILIDFWTYSCINCLRTLPYVTAWYDKYHDSGLEIIGIHAPEFEFEKKLGNVQRAVEKFGIKYPVVLDNDHQTWMAFRNQYWPREYLIDIDGYIVHDHAGEGGYDETEMEIRKLLDERAARLGKAPMQTEMANISAVPVEFRKIGTPEIYLGHDFTRGNFGNDEYLPDQQEVKYALPERRTFNNVYLDGKWFVDSDHVRLIDPIGKVVLTYSAKDVHIVASADPGSKLDLILDGKKINTVAVKDDDLYTIVPGTTYGEHTVEFDVSGAGFRLYTFTFG